MKTVLPLYIIISILVCWNLRLEIKLRILEPLVLDSHSRFMDLDDSIRKQKKAEWKAFEKGIEKQEIR